MPNGLVRGYVRHLVSSSPAAARTDPLDQGLVAEWRFDPPTGLMVPDYSGRGNRGTVNGCTWITNESGPRMDFDNSYVSAAQLHLTSAITVAALFNADGSDSWEAIVCEADATNNNWELRQGDDGNYDWVIWIGGDTTVADGTAAMATGVDIYLVGVFDGATSKIYKNGILEDEKEAIGSIDNDPVALWIGGRSNDSDGTKFDGQVASIQIYNRALTAAEVWKSYRRIKGSRSSLYAWMMAVGKSPVTANAMPMAMDYYRRRRIA